MANAVRIYVFQLLVLSGILMFTAGGRAAEITTPTLFAVHVTSESGQPVADVEAMMLVEFENMASITSAGTWKPAQNGIVSLSADDNQLLWDKDKSEVGS